ncbi:MAG: GHMP kinase [Solirubrobacter sp.]|nr:GHMP kinase [Solirubrobacter sp.]
MMKTRVRMPGSCGELVQGALGEIDFHITCPINRYSDVRVSGLKEGAVRVADYAGTAYNSNDANYANDDVKYDKTTSALRKALERIGTGYGAEVLVQSGLPRGKGMASSTADIAAAVAAVFEVHGRPIDPHEIAEIALSVEPTDGIIFDGIVAFDHLKGRMLQALGEAPPLEILALEPPKDLDTIRFNKDKARLKDTDKLFVKEAFDMAVEGLASNNLRLIGSAASLSSILNQKLLYKPELDDVMAVCRTKGGLGVNVAHSGTVMGMLVEKGFGHRLFNKVSHYIPRSWDAYVVEVINGGIRSDPADTRYPPRKATDVAAYEAFVNT